MKKIVSIMLIGVIALYAVSLGIILEISCEAKIAEFVNEDYSAPKEGKEELIEMYNDGIMSLESLGIAMSEYDTLGVKMPHSCYTRFFDSAGNLISESDAVLRVQLVKENPFSRKIVYLNIGQYLTEEIKQKFAEKENNVTFELYRDGDTIIPVAMNVTWYDDNLNETQERIKLTDYQANLYSVYDYSTLVCDTGDPNENITIEYNDQHLRMNEDEAYEYLIAYADGYCQSARDGQITDGASGGIGIMDGNPFVHVSYGVCAVNIGNYRYYHYDGIAVNVLEAVFDDMYYVKLLIGITVAFALAGALMCGVTVYIFRRDYE